MARRILSCERMAAFLVTTLVVLASSACSQAAPPAPTAAPPKPTVAAAAPPTVAPAAPATAAPAVQPTAVPAAQPAKPAAQAIELRAGSSLAIGHIVDDTLNKFAELVGQKSNGELVVRNLSGSLGVEQQLLQAVASGSVDMGQLSNGNSGRFSNAYYVFDLPFLFKSYDNMLKSLDSPIGKRLMEQFGKDAGVKVLFPIGYAVGRDIQTRNKPLKTPADIKGLKIRVISSPVDLATFKAWGANPTPVDWAQTFPALQQGVVDGLQVPLTDMGPNKLYEVCKYNLRIEYQMLFQQLYMNPKKFESLAPAHQKILLDAAADTVAWNRKEAANRRDQTIKDLSATYGVQSYTPTPDELTQWTSVREKVWQEVAGELKDKIDMDVAKQLYESQ